MFNQISELMHASPFEPFALVLSSGIRLRIPHPDYIFLHPEKTTVSVAVSDGAFRILNVAHIVSVDTKAKA